MKCYEVEILPENIKRSNGNETDSPIIPIEILNQNLFLNLNQYPESQYLQLIQSSAKFYNIDAKYTIPTNGSDEAIDLCIRTFCNPGEQCVVLQPTFDMYKQYLLAFGIKILEFALLTTDFSLNIDGFIKFCQEIKPKMIFLPNPIAPTGGVIKIEDIIRIITKLPNSFVLIDEAYIEFSENKSMISYINQYENLIVTRTLSKFYGLASIRLGFAFTRYTKEMMKIKAPYNVNGITCQIGINLFENITNEIILQRFQENKTKVENMKLWLEKCSEIKEIYHTHTNFLFIKLNCDSKIFAEKLLKEKNIKIKSFAGNISNFCRISV